jgi:signal transduction histidine kinase
MLTTPGAGGARWVALGVLVAGLLLTAIIEHGYRDSQYRLGVARAVASAETIGNELRFRVLAERASLVAAATLYHGSEAVTGEELAQATDVIRRSDGYARTSELAWLREDPDGNYRVVQSTVSDGLLSPGASVAEVPALMATLDLARRESPALQLGELFELDGRRLLAMAVTAPNRGEAGTLVELLGIDQVLGDLARDLLPDGIQLRVFHPGAPGIEQARIGDSRSFTEISHRQAIDMGAFEWDLEWRFSDALIAGHGARARWILWLAGLLVSASLALLFHTVLGRKRQVEQEVQRQRRELESTYTDLHAAMKAVATQERMAALGQLVAGVAHELNTPIGNALLAASTLNERHAEVQAELANRQLRQSTLNSYLDSSSESARLVQQSLERTVALLDGFRQVAVDRASERRRQFDLATTLDEITAMLAPQIRRSRGRLEQQVHEGISMDSFPGPLGQVITNLITNSLRHGFADGEAGRMILSAQRMGDDRVELRYSDDGSGIAESIRGRVFDPFFTTRLGDGGSGLGLHIVFNLVRDVLGGSIRCEASDCGARFVIDLPIQAPGG